MPVSCYYIVHRIKINKRDRHLVVKLQMIVRLFFLKHDLIIFSNQVIKTLPFGYVCSYALKYIICVLATQNFGVQFEC